MPTITANYRKTEDTFIVGVTAQQNYNYGNLAYILVGNTTTSSPYMRGLLRFNIPKFDGEVISQYLRLYIQAQVGTAKRAVAIYKITEPQEDLWKEGTGNGAPDDYGATWNRYTLGRNWTIAGGDFDITKPICIIPIEPTMTGIIDLPICLDNLKIEAGTSNSFILILSNESTIGTNNYLQFDVSTIRPVDLFLEIMRDEAFVAPEVIATGITSSSIQLSWQKPPITMDEFTKLEIIRDGAIVQTITDFDISSWIDTGIITQANLHPTNPKFDAYPNGITKSYTFKWYTPQGIIQNTSSIVATTLKPMPAFSIITEPASSYTQTSFSDDNKDLKPYSVRMLIDWLDKTNVLPLEQIDRMDYMFEQRGATSYTTPVLASSKFISFEEGCYTPPTDGYVPQRMSTIKAFDTGGLYRIATDNPYEFQDNFDGDEENIDENALKWSKSPIGASMWIGNNYVKSTPRAMRLDTTSGGIIFNTIPIPHLNNIQYASFSFIKLASTQPMFFRLTQPSGTGLAIGIDVSSGGLLSYRNAAGAIVSMGIILSNLTWYRAMFKVDFNTNLASVYLFDSNDNLLVKVEGISTAGWALTYFDTMMFVSTLSRVYNVDDFFATSYQYQTVIAFPSPCAVAIPQGKDRTSLPPDFKNTPSFSGDLTLDLQHAAQQIGEPLHEEKFTTPLLSSVYYSKVSNGLITQTLSYPTTDILRQRVASGVMSQFWATTWIKPKDYDPVPANYNPLSNISKYTSSYHLDLTFRVSFSDGITTNRAMSICFCGWSTYGLEQYDKNDAHGYSVRLSDTHFTITHGYGLYNFPALPITAAWLLDVNLGTDNPLHSSGYDHYIHIEIFVSPLFNNGLGGDRILVAYKRNASRAIAENIDWSLANGTGQYIFVVDSLVRWTQRLLVGTLYDIYDQKNYSGIIGFNLAAPSFPTSAWANIDWYKMIVNGKVDQNLPSGSGFGMKDLTNNIVHPLKPTTPQTFPFSCSPDLPFEDIYIEGRIKNLQGAQSPNHTWSGRAGKDFQGGRINNAQPIAFIGAPKVGFIGKSVVVNCSQSIDPEGGALVYILNFGDGTIITSESKTTSHTYSLAGTYTIKLKVIDEAGIQSAEVQSIIEIFDTLTLFTEIEPMSPWTSISENSPTGTSSTPLAEVDYDVVQTMLGGNRVFSITGIHCDTDCTKTEAERMTSAEAERELFHYLKNQGSLITLDLIFFGKVRGVIIEHNPSMDYSDQDAFAFSLTFQEIREEQFGE